MRPTSLLLALMLVFPLAACGYTGDSVDGQVLEAGTRAPIAGAIVVVIWQGTAFSFVESPTVCIHVETATTDKDGRYRIPYWRASTEPSGVRGLEPYVAGVYKVGYQRSTRRMPDDLGGGDQFLRPFKGTRVERFKSIRISGVNCGNAGESNRNLIPLYRTIYEQLNALAETKEEKYDANAYLNKIEEIERPYEEASRRDEERLKRIRYEK